MRGSPTGRTVGRSTFAGPEAATASRVPGGGGRAVGGGDSNPNPNPNPNPNASPNPNPNHNPNPNPNPTPHPHPSPSQVGGAAGGAEAKPTLMEALYAGLGRVVEIFRRFDLTLTDEVDKVDFRRTIASVLVDGSNPTPTPTHTPSP